MSERGRDRYDRSLYGSGTKARPSSAQETPADQPVDSTKEGESADAGQAGREAVAKKPHGDILRNAIIAIVAVVILGAGAAFAYVNGITSNLHEGVDQDLRDALVHTDMANEPFYMLLLGTDGSAERYEDVEFGDTYRSDSMMLARVDPVHKKATLISIPRDLSVDLGEHGEQKINAAYAYGGAALAVKAVSQLAGVPISHYAEVDFDGFAAMVDALGGIEVEVPIAIDDWEAGGALDAGLQTLNGAQSLILSRSRNAYADISAHPDEMRAANQRLVLSAIAKKLLASDVATIAATTSAMSEHVTTDLELNDIIGLAQVMRGLDPSSDIYTAAVPTTSQYVDEGWYEFLNKSEWQAMMDRVKSGLPPLEQAVVDEMTGTVLATSGAGTYSTAEKYALVTVMNATEIEGLASKVRTDLRDAGFVNVEIGTAVDTFDYPETLIIYERAENEREANQIADVIGQGRTFLNDGSYILLNADFMVVIGDDWQN